MLEKMKSAWRIPELRKKIIYTFGMLLVYRLLCVIPVPGINVSAVASAVKDYSILDFMNMMTGGSFQNMSIMAMGITPYINSSIILQLLTVAIPALEKLANEGPEGRKKINEYTRYLTVVLAFIQAVGLVFAMRANSYGGVWYLVIGLSMAAGSALAMWIGERITEKGVGNGISIVLLFNIVSSLPQDVNTLYTRFLSNSKNIGSTVLIVLIMLAVTAAMVVFVIILQDGERRIPVQYSKKMVGRKLVGGQASHIPLKVNTAGVIPVIFASSIMSFPIVIAQFFHPDYTTIGGKILMVLNSSYWFRPEMPAYSVGLVIYLVLIVLFAYFYTSITFNPLEVANNMKKSGGFIPGVRPGKPTSEYLDKILNYIVFIGAVGLIIVSVIPIIISGVFTVSRLSFMGTSLIIIVSVILETIKAIESQMIVRNYKGFLND